jgi:hypothetical protein
MLKLHRGKPVAIEDFFDLRYFEFLYNIGQLRAVAEDLIPSLARTTNDKAEFMIALGFSEGLLEKKALLLEEDQITPEKPWVFLTRDGLNVVGLSEDFYCMPTEGERKHARAVQKVLRGYLRGRFGKRFKKGHVVSERCFFELHDRCKDHIADAAIEVNGKIEVLIELERSRKKKNMVVKILKKMRKLYPEAKIDYHCEPYARPVVERAVGDLGLQKWVRIYDAPKYAGLS